jgi:hypothetical protein
MAFSIEFTRWKDVRLDFGFDASPFELIVIQTICFARMDGSLGVGTLVELDETRGALISVFQGPLAHLNVSSYEEEALSGLMLRVGKNTGAHYSFVSATV